MRTARYSTQWLVNLRQRRENVFDRSVRKMFDVETFIEAVKDRPALYNVNHKNYNRKDIRTRLWEEIGHIMYPEWRSFDVRDKNEKVSIMQKKWKSLKDCFNREIRLQKSRDPKKLRKKYEFYDRLSFLLRKHNPTAAPPTSAPLKEVRVKLENPEPEMRPPAAQPLNLPVPPQSISGQNHEPVVLTSPEGNSRKRKIRNEEEFAVGLKRKLQRRGGEESENGDRLFLMSFVNDLKKLPFATKYWVKMKFSEIMHQAAMSLDGYHEADYANTSVEYDQEVGSPGNGYMSEYGEEESPPDPSSSEIYDLCQD